MIKLKNKDKVVILVVFLAMILSFVFGFYQIEKASLTDEHYWVFDRAPKFWENILEKDANGTRRSDKPGETLMVLLGPSVLKTGWLQDKKDFSQEEIIEIYFVYRLPILIFATFSLIIFYFLLVNLFGKLVAAFGTIFIGLSPILIGMSRAVNPDSLLWIFCAWAILSYFIFLKKLKKNWRWLVLSGFFMGLALLTKYVANILYVYFLGIIILEFIFQNKKSHESEKKIVIKHRVWAFLIFCFVSVLSVALLYPAIWAKWSRLFLATLGSEAFLPIWKLFVLIVFALALDVFVFGNRIFVWVLKYFERYKKYIGQIIFAIFLLIIGASFLNVYLGNLWFDYEAVLSSPKSAHFTESNLSIFISNFYPLLFGISPLIVFFILWLSVKAAIGKLDFTLNNNKAALYLLIFILLYHLSSVFSQVASIIRYQIILYPIILILGALGVNEFIKDINLKKWSYRYVIIFAMIVLLVLPLWRTKPFYMAYASVLFPASSYLDLKDMGYGSYEASQFLNTLPDAQNLLVWTDKSGICDFFVGKCTSNLEFKELKKEEFDYYVISSGRFSRVNRLVQVRVDNKSPNTIRFDKLYDVEKPFWELDIAGRKSNFVKIIKAGTIDIGINN